MDLLDTKDCADSVTRKGMNAEVLSFWVAVITSLLAVFGALSGLMSSRCSTRGLVAKNDAIFAQSSLTDQWAFYQSRNIRKEIAEIRLDLLGKRAPKSLQSTIGKYEEERELAFQTARSLEIKRDEQNKLSEIYLDLSKIFASSLILLQLAIVLIPITILVRRASFLAVGGIFGLAGWLMFVSGIFQFYRIF